MKTLKNTLFLFMILVSLGCSKSDDGEDLFQSTMEAKINGELVIFDSVSGDGSFDLENSCFKMFHRFYGGFSINNEPNAPVRHTIWINIAPSRGIGTYNPNALYYRVSGPDSNSKIVYYSQNYFCGPDQTPYMNEGEVKIISNDNGQYKGVFHFTASNCDGSEIISVTDGKFELTMESELPGSCVYQSSL